MRYKIDKKDDGISKGQGARVFISTCDEFEVKNDNLGWHQISFDEFLSEKECDKE